MARRIGVFYSTEVFKSYVQSKSIKKPLIKT